MNLTKILTIITVLLTNLVLIFNYSFSKGNPTCSHYIFNTYLYIILGLIFMTIMCIVNETKNILYIPHGIIELIIFFILWAILLVFIYKLPQKYYPLTHILWTISIYLLACLMFPIYSLSKDFGVLKIGVLITIGIIVVVSLIGHYFKGIFNFDLRKYLRWALLFLIIAEFVLIYLPIEYNLKINLMIGLSFIGVIIFGLFLLSYTKDLKKRSDECVDANYPKESIKFILSIINLLSDILRIFTLSKTRRRFKK